MKRTERWHSKQPVIADPQLCTIIQIGQYNKPVNQDVYIACTLSNERYIDAAAQWALPLVTQQDLSTRWYPHSGVVLSP